MNTKRHTRHSILFIWISIIMLVSGIATALFTTLLIHYRITDLIETTDARLLMAAEMTREIIGPDFHDNIKDSTSISQEQFDLIVKRNDDLCRRLNLQYWWSVLLVDDQFVFTSATHSDILDPASPSAAFFEVHRDPDSFRQAMGPELNPVFSTFNNEWGTGRQVLIPRKDENGRLYIFGASVQLDEFIAMLWMAVLVAVAIGFAVMGGSFLLTLTLARRLTIPIIQLTETADKMAGGDLGVSLPLFNIKELQSLSDSLDQLRHGLKKRINELSKQTDLLDATQQITKIGGWEWDVEQKTMFWTKEVYSIHGLSPEDIPSGSKELIERSKLCYEPDDRPVVQATFQDCIEKGLPYTFELPFTPLHGKRIWVRTKAEAVFENDKIVRVIGNIMDITERKHSEQAIRESEEKYRLLINNTHDVIYMLTAAGVFTFVSPAWTTLLGHSVSQVIGRSFQNFVHSDDIPACLDWLQKVINTRARLEGIEYRVRHMDGSWHWHTSSAVPLTDGDGAVVGINGIARDITDRKLVEEKIHEDQIQLQLLLTETERSRQALLSVVEDQKEAEEQIRKLNNELEERVRDRTVQLESSNKELEAFSYSVSHDLRAPLRGIDGWSQALKEDYEDKLDEKGLQFIDRIRSETTRMGNLIEGLLNLSRITRLDMNMESVDLSVLAQEVWRRLEQENQHFSYEFIIQPGLVVMADRNLITIVLTNLIGNAEKFSSKTPHPHIEIGSTIIEGQLTYFVRDNGAGFDMAFAKNLFGTFQRMHKQSEFPGTGVGLSTVQRIINRHGGKVWAEAKVNQGATFYFTLSEDKQF